MPISRQHEKQMPFRPQRIQRTDGRSLFPTRSHSWAEAGLARHLSRAAVKRARIETLLLVPLAVGVLVLYAHRKSLFPGLGMPVRIVTVIALLALGWALARSAGRVLGPSLMRRLDPSTAGTVGFLVRLVTMFITALVALRIAGVRPRDLAVGGAFTAVVVGLAAQQTLGNLFAGMVLLSARPFRVGERVRLQGGGIAGQIEGIVSSLGLLYTTLARGEDRVMIPNGLVLNAAVVPLLEPDAVDLRARLRVGLKPSEVQALLHETISVPTRSEPHISLEELDGDEVIVRIQATPELARDGAKLADEILAAMALVTREHEAVPD
jgi:small-conductance mechanosensitive channel